VADQGLTWQYRPTAEGFEGGALVTNRRGPKTYTIHYQLLGGGPALRVDAQGDLVGGFFSLARPTVIGSDLSTRQAGAWRVLAGSRAAFDFDDSSLPAGAFPYFLDPTVTFNEAKGIVDDDMARVGPAAPYPPAGSVQFLTDQPYASSFRNNDTGGNFDINNALFRWNVQVPANAVYTNASLQSFSCRANTIDGESAVGDYFGSQALSGSLYHEGAPNTALGGFPIASLPSASDPPSCVFGLKSGVANPSLPLTLTQVAAGGNGLPNSGYTGIGFHVSPKFPQPSGENVYAFVTAEGNDPTQAPRSSSPISSHPLAWWPPPMPTAAPP